MALTESPAAAPPRSRAARAAAALDPLPFAVLAALICVLPILALIVLATQGGGDYLRHLIETQLALYARNSAALAGMVAMGTCLLGVPAAWLTARHDFPARGVFAWAVALPLAAPSFVIAYAWTSLTTAGGPLYMATDGAFPAVRGLPGAAFVFTVTLYPYVFLLARQAFETQGAHAFDAARTLGAGARETFWRVGLPLARPAIAAGMALAIMETLADYGAVDFLGAPTFTTGIIRAWASFGEPATAAQLALILLTATFLAFTIERQARKRRSIAQAAGRHRVSPRTPLGRGAAAGAVILCLTPLMLGLVIPASRLIYLAIETPGHRSILPPLFNTIKLAGAAAFVAVLIGLGAAYALRHGGRFSKGAARAAQAGYAIPGAVAAVGVLALLGFLQRLLDAGWGDGALVVTGGSLMALIFAYQARFAAAAIGPAEAALLRVSPSLDQAARTLGASPLRIIGRVHLPLMFGGLATGALIVFVEVMKELPATMILRPFDYETLAIMAHHYASDERLSQAASPSLALIALGLPAMMAVAWLVSGKRLTKGAE